MSLESLANELLLDLFEYINGVDLLISFSQLNYRFNQLLSQHFQLYNIDFRSISKNNFNIVCQKYLPLVTKRVISLHLSNDDETPELPNIFLTYGLTLDHFICLKSLKLYSIRSIDLLDHIIIQCQLLLHLFELHMIDCYFSFEHEQMQNLLNNIWNLKKLTHWKFDREFSWGMWLKNISTVSKTIKYLSIENTRCCFTDLSYLFKYAPNIRALSTSFATDIQDKLYTILMPKIISVKLIFNGCLSSMKSLFKTIPNLHHLTIYLTSFYLDGYEWERILKDYLPKIEVFQLKMNVNNLKFYRNESEIDKYLDSFRTYFWIEQHKWFVRYDWNPTDINNHSILYTLPYSFDNFAYLNPIKSKSTCSDDKKYFIYYKVTKFLQPNEDKTLENLSTISNLQFPNIRHLEINLPLNNNLWLENANFNRLASLHMKISNRNLNYHKLQELFDNAPHLNSLVIGIDNWIPIDHDFFQLKTKSIQNIRFVNRTKLTIQYLNKKEFDTLISSSIVLKCKFLTLGIENREKIFDLIKTMSNLQSLIIQCDDDTLYSNIFLPENDEFMEWLCTNLPSTYSITRDSNASNIRIWIG